MFKYTKNYLLRLCKYAKVFLIVTNLSPPPHTKFKYIIHCLTVRLLRTSKRLDQSWLFFVWQLLRFTCGDVLGSLDCYNIDIMIPEPFRCFIRKPNLHDKFVVLSKIIKRKSEVNVRRGLPNSFWICLFSTLSSNLSTAGFGNEKKINTLVKPRPS